MIDGKSFFDQPIKSFIKTYGNIRKIATGEGDDYTTGCFFIIISKTIIRRQQQVSVNNKHMMLIQKQYKK